MSLKNTGPLSSSEPGCDDSFAILTIMRKPFCYYFILMFAMTSCGSSEKGERIPAISQFDDDVTFLKKYSDVIELRAPDGDARIAVMPGLQARVMTSTAGGPGDLSYGWINR